MIHIQQPLGERFERPNYTYCILFIILGTIFNLTCALLFVSNSNQSSFIVWKLDDTKQIDIKTHTGMNVIDLHKPIKENFTCLKTNQLFKVIRTTICVHNISDFVSRHFIQNKTYEEEYMHILFRILLRYPHFGLIDVGANIGTYTMFAAAMDRLVIAIECFQPNYMRIAKAIQIEHIFDRVILIGNAIYSQSGRYLNLSSDPQNIGGQTTYDTNITDKLSDDPHIVKTIRFDDILPIIRQKKHRFFLLKADIEASEYYIFDSGTELFSYLDIPIIMIEWDRFRDHTERGAAIIRFLTKRGYIPTTDTCQEISMTNTFTSWPANVFWTKMNRSGIC